MRRNVISASEDQYSTIQYHCPNVHPRLLGDSTEKIQSALNNKERYSKVVGLRINASKTKVMSTQPRPGAQHVITLGGVPLEEVESFKYLGSSFTATGQTKDEISGMIGLALSAFTRLKATLWSRRKI